MAVLLFPGRHLLLTHFQKKFLEQLLQTGLGSQSWLDEAPPAMTETVTQIVFAITSSNQANSRYNPIPFHVRAIGVDRFARPLKEAFDIRYRIIGVPHYRPTPRFAEHVLKEIVYQTEGRLALKSDNCVVLCGTQGVQPLYRALGFSVLPAELAFPADSRPERPGELLQTFVAAGEQWANDKSLREKMAPATFALWQDFPDVPRRVLRLWRDPLLNESGDLTGSRDYASYTALMSNSEIISLKYQDIREAIVPGRIVDEGCGDGALLVPVSRDYPDSDLIGIEITGEFIARAQERQRAGEFGGSFVHFYQRNITERIFEDDSIDTTLCNSTLHELWSYGQQAMTVRDYLAKKFRQTRPDGRLVIRDVVGPREKERPVYLWLADDDGQSKDVFRDEFADLDEKERYLGGLSTFGRFLRFARDFQAELRAAGKRPAESEIEYHLEVVDGRSYVLLPLQDAAEFMSKKDYINNWDSEMNEAFAFWDFEEWKQALQAAGFRVIEDVNRPDHGSRVYTNPWIVENRWQGKVGLYQMQDGRLQPLPYPVTNMVLVGEKSAGITGEVLATN